MSLRRTLIFLAVGAGVLWLTACAGLLVMRHSLIYPFRDWPDARQVSGLPGAVVAEITAHDGTPLLVWRVAPLPNRPTVFYFKGNGGSLPSVSPRLRELVHRGYGIVALNYRGAGRAPGAPRQIDLVRDAMDVFEQFAPDRKDLRVIYGSSLGAAVATQLAARREASALILETPFARLCETAQYHYPVIPACQLLWDERWDSIDVIADIDMPLLVLHGDADGVIPVAHGQKLFDAAPDPKVMHIYAGGRHNDLRLYGAGKDIIGFLETLPDQTD